MRRYYRNFQNQKFDGAEYINKDVFKLTNENFVDVDYIFHLAFITNIPNSISNPQVQLMEILI